MTNGGEADGAALAEELSNSAEQQPPNGDNSGTDDSSAVMGTIARIAAPKSRDQTTTPDDFVCAVCHELPISADDSRVTSCCHHLFCKGCIDQSIRANNACPFCRADLTNTAGRHEASGKPLDGIARRVFESVPVACSREGCIWEGCVGAYLGHAEECSVSTVSKVELGRMVRQLQADLKEKTRLYEGALDDMNGMVNHLQDELKEKIATKNYHMTRYNASRRKWMNSWTRRLT